MNSLKASRRVASFWRHLSKTEGPRVQCCLCPRKCEIGDDRVGFCGVRGVLGSELHTLNYGLSLPLTEEVIETEAVYHYGPGSRILSLGNIGCNMSCSFCQNWETSQAKLIGHMTVRNLDPEHIISTCLRNDIDIISWTYNDPVVWHEFVVDTSNMARRNGIKTLYKSALFIEEQPLLELMDCIDLFSISLKSMSPDFYREIAHGELDPVLDRIKLLAKNDQYLEISQLVVTESNDDIDDRYRTVRWVLDSLGDSIPLHFVGFHPSYKFLSVDRTPLSKLLEARELALSEGIKHCYVGNVCVDGINDTTCERCGNLLVRRLGLSSEVVGIDENGLCAGCRSATPIRHAQGARDFQRDALHQGSCEQHKMREFSWSTEVSSVHLDRATSVGLSMNPMEFEITHLDSGFVTRQRLGEGIERLLLSKHRQNDRAVRIEWEGTDDIALVPLSDRAHFPLSRDCTTRS